jgi:hypothetical protein
MRVLSNPETSLKKGAVAVCRLISKHLPIAFQHHVCAALLYATRALRTSVLGSLGFCPRSRHSERKT